MPRTSFTIRVAVRGEEGHVEGVDLGGHAIDAGDGAQGAGVVVGAAVAHDAHGADREQHGEGLPDRVVQARGPDLLQEDRVGAAEDGQAFLGDGAGDADGEAGAGEGGGGR